MKAFRIAALALVTGAGLLTALPAAAKTARCDIHSADGVYGGPCIFTPGHSGSFTLSPVRARYLIGGTMTISVDITGPSIAEVRGLTGEGVNSRWGEARRSSRDPACWLGADFSICAY